MQRPKSMDGAFIISQPANLCAHAAWPGHITPGFVWVALARHAVSSYCARRPFLLDSLDPLPVCRPSSPRLRPLSLDRVFLTGPSSESRRSDFHIAGSHCFEYRKVEGASHQTLQEAAALDRLCLCARELLTVTHCCRNELPRAPNYCSNHASPCVMTRPPTFSRWK